MTDAGASTFLDDVLDGLARPQKALPAKYFYDERGSALFDQITELEAYYPTRTETAILRTHADAMAAAIGPEAAVFEFGSGSSTKTPLLLEALDRPSAYVPIDISGEHLHRSAERLQTRFPTLPVIPVTADYTEPLALPALPPHRRRIVFFPGSTIGNFTHDEAQAFLRTAAALAGPGGGLLLGADLVKDAGVLERAYDDPEGVTAAFNKNVLRRINRELGGDFDLAAFRHRAVWNAEAARIEMYLVSERKQTVRVGEHRFAFEAGEAIHTEHSHKYTPESLAALARPAGFEPEGAWFDARRWFGVFFLRLGGW